MASCVKFVLALGLFVLTACGGMTDAGSASTPGASPNCEHQLTHTPGSWLLTNANIRFVFWGKYWVDADIEETAYQATWQKLVHGGVFDRLAEYGIQGAMLDSYNYSVKSSDDLKTNSVDDDAIPTELNSDIAAGQLPVPTDQTVFVVFLPPGALTPFMVKQNYNGYHTNTSYGHTNYAFAVIEYYPFNQTVQEYVGTNGVMSHELYEAFTDPDTSTGYTDSGNEVGDLCGGQFVKINDIAIVQKVWSEGACKCL